METTRKKFYSDTSDLFFSPIRGRHYAIANGNTVEREIFLDQDSPDRTFPFTPLIPFFETIHRFPFVWKMIMTEQRAYELGLQPILTFDRNVSEVGEQADKYKTQKLCLVLRKVENQHYLLDREVHPFEIEVLSKDSGAVKVIYKFTVKIDDMLAILANFASGNFLGYIEEIIKQELTCVMQEMELDEIRGLKKKGLLDDIEKIIKRVNRAFKKNRYGFTLLRILHEAVIILPATQKLIDVQLNIEIEKQNEKVEKQKVEVEKQKADQAKARAQGSADSTKITGKAETEVLTQRSKDLGKIEADNLVLKLKAISDFQATSRAIADVNLQTVAEHLGGVQGTLVNPNIKGDDELTNLIIANSIQNTQQQNQRGGSNG